MGGSSSNVTLSSSVPQACSGLAGRHTPFEPRILIGFPDDAVRVWRLADTQKKSTEPRRLWPQAFGVLGRSSPQNEPLLAASAHRAVQSEQSRPYPSHHAF